MGIFLAVPWSMFLGDSGIVMLLETMHDKVEWSRRESKERGFLRLRIRKNNFVAS